MSRPRLSRPSRVGGAVTSAASTSSPSSFSQDGASHTSPIMSASSKGAIIGARSAPRILMTMIASPTVAAMLSFCPKSRMAAPLPRPPQARIGEDRQNVGDHVEGDIGAGEDEAAGLHHRHVALGHGIDHELAHAGIDE